MKKFIVYGLFCCFSINLYAQKITVTSHTFPIDSTVSVPDSSDISEFIKLYKGGIDLALSKIIAYSKVEMGQKDLLPNFTTDALVKIFGVDFSLLNFGGFRASLPQGDVRLSDLWNIFPFENQIVLASVKGSDLINILNGFAQIPQPTSKQLKIKIENQKVTSILLHGKPIDHNKTYRFVTVDFIVEGGDNIIRDTNVLFDILRKDILLREIIISYCDYKKNINAKLDNRIIIK